EKTALPLFRSTLTPVEFARARSGLPSPFRSTATTDVGPALVGESVLAVKVPSPLFTSTPTVPWDSSATARSTLPSPFRSAAATERGFTPAAASGGPGSPINPVQMQWPRVAQATHMPLPSHSSEPFMPQGVLFCALVEPGVPLLHEVVTQLFGAVGTFVSSGTDSTPPLPSHWFFWQLPMVCI